MGTARVAGTAWGPGRAPCASTPSPGTASEGVRRQALQFPGPDPSNNRRKGSEDTQGHCQGLEPQKVVFSLGRKKTGCKHKLYFLEEECVFPTCLFIYKPRSTKFHRCGYTSPTLVPRLCVRMTLANCCVLPVWGASAGCRNGIGSPRLVTWPLRVSSSPPWLTLPSVVLWGRLVLSSRVQALLLPPAGLAFPYCFTAPGPSLPLPDCTCSHPLCLSESGLPQFWPLSPWQRGLMSYEAKRSGSAQ